MKERHRRTYSPTEKLDLIKKYRLSGAVRKTWCKENQIGLSTLQRWLKEEITLAEFPSPKWVSIDTIPLAPKSELNIQAGSFNLSINEKTDLQLLKNVLSILAVVC